MSKYDFSLEEYAKRRERVRGAMRNESLDWLVVIHPVSIHWLTGSDAKSYQEFQCLFLSADEGPLCILTREGEREEFLNDAYVDEVEVWGGREIEDAVEAFFRVAQKKGVLQGRVGMEVPAYYLHPHDYIRIREGLGKSLVAEPTHLIPRLRMVKSERELGYIREAARIADEAMKVFVEGLRAGRTELELAGDVYQALLSRGSGIAASPINLVSGERSCYSHGAPTERVLCSGDFGSIEYGATYKRYTATIGRNFCIGEPTRRMKELHEAVCRASDACMAEMRDGVPAYIPHAAARKVLIEAGLECGRVHTTGYALAPGFPPSWGEPLHMLEGCNEILREGMIVTVEPPVFLGDEKLGARVIDNVLVTREGVEVLSRFPRDLILK